MLGRIEVIWLLRTNKRRGYTPPYNHLLQLRYLLSWKHAAIW